jgi:hypothetical protein
LARNGLNGKFQGVASLGRATTNNLSGCAIALLSSLLLLTLVVAGPSREAWAENSQPPASADQASADQVDSPEEKSATSQVLEIPASVTAQPEAPISPDPSVNDTAAQGQNQDQNQSSATADGHDSPASSPPRITNTRTPSSDAQPPNLGNSVDYGSQTGNSGPSYAGISDYMNQESSFPSFGTFGAPAAGSSMIIILPMHGGFSYGYGYNFRSYSPPSPPIRSAPLGPSFFQGPHYGGGVGMHR